MPVDALIQFFHDLPRFIRRAATSNVHFAASMI